MKIMICGSMSFARKMIQTKRKLEKMGHVVEIPSDVQKFIDNPDFTTDNYEDDYKHCVENEIFKKHFNFISKSNAILVLNFPKNDINGYIGAGTLMDIGVAFHLDKKIFLLNQPPKIKEARSSHEIRILQPIILDGNLDKIQEHI